MIAVGIPIYTSKVRSVGINGCVMSLQKRVRTLAALVIAQTKYPVAALELRLIISTLRPKQLDRSSGRLLF